MFPQKACDTDEILDELFQNSASPWDGLDDCYPDSQNPDTEEVLL